MNPVTLTAQLGLLVLHLENAELFNLEDDPGESDNLSATAVEVTTRLSNDLQTFRHCQMSYYADKQAWSTLQPPRYQ